MNESRISYYDHRFGCYYEILLDNDLEFEIAYRYGDHIGKNAIVYDSVEELPAWHRRAIEDLIEKHRRKHSPL